MEPPASELLDVNDQSSFLDLPKEVRIELLQFAKQDRHALRQVCSTLNNDIDRVIGPSNILHLSDQFSKDELDFYGRTYFPQIKISSSYLFDGFQNVLYKPEWIRSLTLQRDGIIGSNFLEELLQKSRTLTTLNLKGLIKGEISRQGARIFLPKLKKLQLKISDRIYEVVPQRWIHRNFIRKLVTEASFMENAFEMWMETQLAFLSRLTAPCCAELVLELGYRPNIAQENFDEIELVQMFVDFIFRHPDCRRLKIISNVFGQNWYLAIMFPKFKLTSANSYYHRRAKTLNPQDAVQGPAAVQLPKFKNAFGIKDLTYISNVSPQVALEISLVEFMESLEGLEKLNLQSDPDVEIRWNLFINLVQKNGQTLKQIILDQFWTNNVLDHVLDIFYCCPSLKILWISYSSNNENLPIILTPTNYTINNLTTVILRGGYGIDPEFFTSIPELINLKYLSLSGVRSQIPFRCLQRILNMRSLDGIVVQLSNVTYPENVTGGLSTVGLQMYRDLRPFISQSSLILNITDTVNPWWTVMKDEKFSFHSID